MNGRHEPTAQERKASLRATMQQRRLQVPRADRRAAAEAVRDRVLALDLPGPVLVFVSVRGEIGTRMLIDALPQVAVPRIVGRDLEARLVQGELVPGSNRIPTSEGPLVEPAAILLPGLAFDLQGGRLGYGGGFYDRYLTGRDVPLYALAYGFQLVDRVPTEPHDVRVHGIVTPESLHIC